MMEGRQSPVEMKPDAGSLLTTVGGLGNATSPGGYPASHPLSGAKHMCSICGDRASGKHYGVYSCEGCKGFFKRTVRKELKYSCREDENCIVDKRQRNRCQFCRYNKCLNMGMKREAVQEERGVSKGRDGIDGGDGDDSNMGGGTKEMAIERILEAEQICDRHHEPTPGSTFGEDMGEKLKAAGERHLVALVEWAKQIPHFTDLNIEDQVCLLRSGWNELMIMGFSHRSVGIQNGILLSGGIVVTRENAHDAGVGAVFDRVLVELVVKMQEIKMDKAELGCLRTIVLLNPDAKGLRDVHRVEQLREKVYATLEEYTRSTYENESGRFAKLLLRLPALRSIGLKCNEHLFFFKIITDNAGAEYESPAGFGFHLKDLLEGRGD